MASPLRLATFVAVSLLSGLPLVSAQTLDQAPPAGQTAGWVFTPSIGLGAAWDDNVLLVHPADKPPPDYASPVSPSLSLEYTGRRTQFSTGYDGSWVFYRNLSNLDSFDQSVRLSARHRATRRVTIFAQEHLALAPTTDALHLAGVPFYRIGTRTNAAGGGFEAALAERTTLRGAYTLRSVDFDANDVIGRELQGGHAHEFNLSLGRSISPRLTLGGDYAFNRAVVGDRQQDLELGQDRFSIQSGNITAQYRLSPTVDLSGGLGVAQLGGGRTHQGRTGPTWGVGVTRRGQRTVLAAAYRRSYVPSFGFGGTFQNEELTGSVLVPFARGRAYVNSSLSLFTNDPLELGEPSLNTLGLSSVLGYRTTRWLNAEVYYARSQQDTQRAGGQLARNQVGFRLVAARPLRLR